MKIKPALWKTLLQARADHQCRTTKRSSVGEVVVKPRTPVMTPQDVVAAQSDKVTIYQSEWSGDYRCEGGGRYTLVRVSRGTPPASVLFDWRDTQEFPKSLAPHRALR